jgi:hypothetical protein
MTNIVKQSLEDNMDVILENLPKEFHSDLKSSVATAAPQAVLSADEAKAEAIACIKENPSIENEDEAIALVNSDPMIGQAIPQPPATELEIQQRDALAEVQASLAE